MTFRSALAAVVAVGLAAPAGALAARDAYVADTASGEILQLAVGATGALAPLVPPSLPATKPRRLAMTPDGRSLFVTAGRSGEGRVLQYDVSPTGLASPKEPPEIPAGEGPVAMAADPAGRALYVADKAACRLLQFTIGAGGRLHALEPLDLTAAPEGVAVSPDGRNAYVIVGGWIKRFAVGADGRLDPDSLISVNTGGNLTDVALTPDGAHLFAASRDGRVFQFAAGGDGGPAGLTPAAAPAADGMPSALAIGPGGTNLYVAAASSTGAEPQLLQYAIGAGGLLTPLTPPGVPVPDSEMRDLAVTPDGRSIYLAGSDLHLFDLVAGGLAAPKSPPALGLLGAAGVVVSPNQAPVARFEIRLAPAGSAVSFDASSAADPDGSIRRYDWDFGDGNVLPNGGPRVSHVYARPGTYQARLLVTDNEGASTRTVFTGSSVLGNGAPSAEAVRLVEVRAAAAAGPGVPAGPGQAPRPDLGETIVVEPAGGRVRVRLPRRRRFVRLETLREIPVGSLVDTTGGRVLLSSVRSRRGGVQQGRFFDGLFLVRQRRTDRYLTELLLRGDYGPCKAQQALSSRAKRRRLWGNARGRFRSRGRYSSGAVRGTRWLVEDSCAGTLTVVRRGRVAVRDFGRGTTTLVGAGERYLARPR
jgi:DNA-binding beta-propeller fold protein YncE